MRTIHYVTIVIALALTAFIYWGGNTVPPAKTAGPTGQRPTGGVMAPGPNTVKAASFDSIYAASLKQLPKTAADSVTSIENGIKAMRDSSRMASSFLQLAHIWDVNNKPAVAGYFGALAAKLENSEKKLNFAGQFFLELMHDAGSQSVQLWEAQEAIDCFKRSLAINPANDTTKIALATGYIEGTGETMQGVQLLLGITREKPENLPANMMLGKMAIQSAQYDKAIKRLEDLLKIYPNNAEAMYFLAEAYKGKGDKQKAIELFEQCKRIVNKKAFSDDIDKYINSFK